MNWIQKVKTLISQNWAFYIIGCAVIFSIKYFYSKAGSNELDWILAPTAWWVRILTGASFERVPQTGYVNHALRFIIAPSCSGVQFIMIAFATLYFSFIHSMETTKRKYQWFALCLVLSYVCTVLVNGFRIALSIYLPLYLHIPEAYRSCLSPQKLHTIIGITVYFTSLFFLYRITDIICCRRYPASEHPVKTKLRQLQEFIPPVFWYLIIVLGLPILNRSYRYNHLKFKEYAILVITVCLPILCAFCFLSVLRKYIIKQK